MSLQVWLPLNGNLNNQGLSGVTFTNESTISVDTSGKIGSCYSRATKQTSGRIISNSKVLFDKSLSICCWAYVSDCVGDTANGLVTIHSHEHNSNVGITVRQYSSTDYRISCNTGIGNDRTYCTYYGSTNIKNTWSHLSLTYDKASKVLKLYVNGNCEYTLNNYTNYAISDNIILFDWSTTYNSPAYRPACKLNDVRIYDHCLSAKEVKEISKGLICHYKLDNKGFGNPNFLVTQSPSDFSRQGNKYTNNVVDSRTNDPFQLQYFKGSTYNSTFYSEDVSSTPCDIKTTFTVPESITGIRVKFNGKSRDLELFSSGKAPVSPGETYTFSCRVLSSKSEIVGGVQVENPKLEKGSVATHWCPHTSDSMYTSLGLNSTIESDCSGNSYNGTLSESLLYASDSPRYSGCYYFNSTSKRITLPTINMSGFSNSFSISWWGKAPSYSSLMYWGFSDGNRLNYYDGMYCNTGDGSSNPYYKPNTTTTISTPSVDTWHHFVMVGDGSSNKLYMDGELYGVAKTYRGITGSTIVINGWDSSTSYKTNGYISDFRMYSTVLSASDIKELYTTAASVDKDGNMYAYEFKEE